MHQGWPAGARVETKTEKVKQIILLRITALLSPSTPTNNVTYKHAHALLYGTETDHSFQHNISGLSDKKQHPIRVRMPRLEEEEKGKQ